MSGINRIKEKKKSTGMQRINGIKKEISFFHPVYPVHPVQPCKILWKFY